MKASELFLSERDQDSNTTDLSSYFDRYRINTIGHDAAYHGPYGTKAILYADWTASGRLYAPIESKLLQNFGPYVANTHTETTFTGTCMTRAYHTAREIIKAHVGAGSEDVFIPTGTGMTGAINKFQRLLGLKVPDRLKPYLQIPDHKRPTVFITHMEHHSNQTSWLETIAKVVIVPAGPDGLVSPEMFAREVDKYKASELKIAAITACSNVTGIHTPYYDIAEIMHEQGGLCFVDFACSAPYVDIDMHPADRPDGYLDAILYSPHKFLGGPGTPGVLIFNRDLYHNLVPDSPGGGTVAWTNPWGEHQFLDDIEAREDGGTPGFIQTIKAAMVMQLKDEMGTKRMQLREEALNRKLWSGLCAIRNLHLLAPEHADRLSIFSFYFEDLHYNLGVKLLNDRFGIQTRGGCSCAGTYGHYLLHVDQNTSHRITCQISGGDLSSKPGWVRMSVHPTTSDEEIDQLLEAIDAVARNHKAWSMDYGYNAHHNEYHHLTHQDPDLISWFL